MARHVSGGKVRVAVTMNRVCAQILQEEQWRECGGAEVYRSWAPRVSH